MSDTIKYGQKVIEMPQDDGTTQIVTEGYFDGLQSQKIQVREDIKTSYATMLTDVIACLEVLKFDSPELTIHITKDNSGSPTLIQKTWLLSKQKIK